jgi:hypothetical protein
MFRLRTVCPIRRVFVIASLAALGACGDQRPTEPAEPSADGSVDGLLSSRPKLVQCHTDESATAVRSITQLGGTVSIGGTSVVFPLGAVLKPTTVELTIPASDYVEIRLKADGAEHFYGLLKPVTVTIDYSRCVRTDLLSKPLSVWYIDAVSKALLEPMGGIDSKITRSITFSTNHFSGYAIAF